MNLRTNETEQSQPTGVCRAVSGCTGAFVGSIGVCRAVSGYTGVLFVGSIGVCRNVSGCTGALFVGSIGVYLQSSVRVYRVHRFVYRVVVGVYKTVGGLYHRCFQGHIRVQRGIYKSTCRVFRCL